MKIQIYHSYIRETRSKWTHIFIHFFAKHKTFPNLVYNTSNIGKQGVKFDLNIWFYWWIRLIEKVYNTYNKIIYGLSYGNGAHENNTLKLTGYPEISYFVG